MSRHAGKGRPPGQTSKSKARGADRAVGQRLVRGTVIDSSVALWAAHSDSPRSLITRVTENPKPPTPSHFRSGRRRECELRVRWLRVASQPTACQQRRHSPGVPLRKLLVRTRALVAKPESVSGCPSVWCPIALETANSRASSLGGKEVSSSPTPRGCACRRSCDTRRTTPRG